MLISQILLIALIGLYAVYVVLLRSALGDRIIYLGLAALGAVLVLRPDWANRAAAHLDIGRGADLMLYFFVIFSLFHFATTAATIRRMQHDLGELTRALARLSPILPADAAGPPPPSS